MSEDDSIVTSSERDSADLLDSEVKQEQHVFGWNGKKPELKLPDEPPFPPTHDHGNHRPERDWFAMMFGVACIAAGMYSIWNGIRLFHEARK